MSRPRIVCLCGSTRFHEEFVAANYRETMAGRIVLSVGFYPHAAGEVHGEGVGCTDEQKAALDELHLRKIDLADEVLVLNVPRPFCLGCDRWCDNQYQAGRFAYEDGHSECCGARWEARPYIGDSTRREIAYARKYGKVIRSLNPLEGP